VAACWFVILAAWTAVALWPSVWLVLFAIPVIGTRYYGLFLVGAGLWAGSRPRHVV